MKKSIYAHRSRKKYAITYVKKEKIKIADPKQKPTEETIKGIIIQGSVPKK
ncbi:MAG TPA: hypothetical protein VNW29_00520 [Candidatus Sulfotelmatobacter sp.]|nr:hypothetical protein [Candidatus Sulfotelmatobacter sp.]